MSMPGSLIRRRAAGQVDARLDIQRATDTTGTGGLPIETFSNHLSDIQCLAEVLSSDEAIRFGRERSSEVVIFHIEAGLDITEEDRVVWDSKTYQILRIRTPGGRVSSDHLAWMVLETEQVAT